MKKRTCRYPLWIVFLSAMLCAGSILSAAQASTSEEALQELYRAAKAAGESEVIWQVSSSLKGMKPFINRFEARFPGIKVKGFSLGGTQVPARIITEAAVGKSSMDVTSGVFELMMPLKERDLLTKLDFLIKTGVDPADLFLGNRLVFGYYDLVPVWIRNTNLVSKKDELHSWEDALDPKWKGNKISVRGAGLFFNSLLPAYRKDKEKVINYLKKLKKQKLVIGSRATQVLRRTVQGETAIGFANLHHLPRALKKGAPIAVMPVSPIVGRPRIYSIPKGVPHPNAAKLFTAWRCTKESTDIYLKMGRGPAIPPGASPMADLLHEAGIEYIRLTKEDDIRDLGPFTHMVEEVLGFRPE